MRGDIRRLFHLRQERNDDYVDRAAGDSGSRLVRNIAIALHTAVRSFTIFKSSAWGRLGKFVEAACDVAFQLWRIGSLVLALIGVALVGCNKPSAKLYPVHGQVFFKDQPAEGAKVVFLPAGEENAQYRGARPAGTVGADGAFEIYTEPHGLGAPAGDYAALITWFPPRDENPGANPKNKLPNKYGDQRSPVLKVTIKEGENRLEPFKLAP